MTLAPVRAAASLLMFCRRPGVARSTRALGIPTARTPMLLAPCTSARARSAGARAGARWETRPTLRHGDASSSMPAVAPYLGLPPSVMAPGRLRPWTLSSCPTGVWLLSGQRGMLPRCHQPSCALAPFLVTTLARSASSQQPLWSCLALGAAGPPARARQLFGTPTPESARSTQCSVCSRVRLSCTSQTCCWPLEVSFTSPQLYPSATSPSRCLATSTEPRHSRSAKTRRRLLRFPSRGARTQRRTTSTWAPCTATTPRATTAASVAARTLSLRTLIPSRKSMTAAASLPLDSRTGARTRRQRTSWRRRSTMGLASSQTSGR
mmetsp:Transcript_17107/g.64798  ORF Transcript_17107/g.64798 Transcript_17107/m.64798 type:complete len:322 (+) Transcript_17107:49-1014(+)